LPHPVYRHPVAAGTAVGVEHGLQLRCGHRPAGLLRRGGVAVAGGLVAARGVTGTHLVRGGLGVAARSGVVPRPVVAQTNEARGVTLTLRRVPPETRALVRHDARPPPLVCSPPEPGQRAPRRPARRRPPCAYPNRECGEEGGTAGTVPVLRRTRQTP